MNSPSQAPQAMAQRIRALRQQLRSMVRTGKQGPEFSRLAGELDQLVETTGYANEPDLPDETPGNGPALEDIFGQRVDLPGGGHADVLLNRGQTSPSPEDAMEDSYQQSQQPPVVQN